MDYYDYYSFIVCTAELIAYLVMGIRRNLRIQQHKISLGMSLRKNIIPTAMGVNTFTTIMFLTLNANCDGLCLIFSFNLRGGRVALVRPNMKRTYMGLLCH